MAVRALINLNERFIDAVSNPAGIIGLFLGLLTVFAILLRFFIYRRLRKKTAAFEQAVSELVQRERGFNETVNAAIARGIRQEKEQLARRREDFIPPDRRPAVQCNGLLIPPGNLRRRLCWPV